MSSGGRIEKRQYSKPVSTECALRQKGVSAGLGLVCGKSMSHTCGSGFARASSSRRHESACAHSTGQRAVHKGRRGPNHCQMSAAPSGSATKRPKAHFRACFHPVRVAGRQITPVGRFGLGAPAYLVLLDSGYPRRHGRQQGRRPVWRPPSGRHVSSKTSPTAFRVLRNSLTTPE